MRRRMSEKVIWAVMGETEGETEKDVQTVSHEIKERDIHAYIQTDRKKTEWHSS